MKLPDAVPVLQLMGEAGGFTGSLKCYFKVNFHLQVA